MAQRLVSSFPTHRHYVEPCGGSLAVLLAKKRSHQETVNDLDQVLMTFWRVLRERTEELEKVCALTPHSRAERELAYSISADLDELEIARRVWVALTQGRTGSITRTGWRHHAATTSTPMPVTLQRYARRLAPAAARLHGVSLECRPAVEVVEAYGRERTNLLYVDPPYIVDRGQRRGGEYRVEMRSPKRHTELLDACLAADAAVVVSGYANQVYDEMLDGWYRYEIAARTHQGTGDGQRVEVVWSNRHLEGLGDTENGREFPLHEDTSVTETRSRCPGCAAVVRQPKTGRRRTWCGEACRIAAWRSKQDDDI
ncbi:D12 class N6 adenine-specific DNA methyltransferase [Mycobacteroides abscessus subsp. abscessus]|nr:D12 class N6 adenine-specific DNA methyltransferase [Mycobacteroides abscessus subsp. abscessus]SHQ60852.1 D12 class N6 adenine-specific DNA methyltransferase [Mycobacteroides abscessus subsp. abscessus]SKD63779.1 D12 class N6 adenine-specific DNA methyltransferase [Mycobacteroides abscessus subsp. abscessus]SLD62954.1 D12 class N6 adenine-specific DNA methyltransferase [Mycobacteroides abscessus subsp. abscessus]